MKKIFTIILLTFFTSAYAAGHMSSKDKEATLACAGLYYANSMIPQGTLKFLTSYLIKEGLKEDAINLKLNGFVDELYGKPYDDKKTTDCDKFIYKLIPGSKAEIEKLVKSGIY